MKELEADLAVDALPAREQQIRAQASQVAADRAALAQAEWRLQQKRFLRRAKDWSSTRFIAKASGLPRAILSSSSCRRKISSFASLCLNPS